MGPAADRAWLTPSPRLQSPAMRRERLLGVFRLHYVFGCLVTVWVLYIFLVHFSLPFLEDTAREKRSDSNEHYIGASDRHALPGIRQSAPGVQTTTTEASNQHNVQVDNNLLAPVRVSAVPLPADLTPGGFSVAIEGEGALTTGGADTRSLPPAPHPPGQGPQAHVVHSLQPESATVVEAAGEEHGEKREDHDKDHDKDDDGVQYPKFVEQGEPDGPGEGGKAAPWDEKGLSPDQKAEWNNGFRINSFNQFASDRISVHRVIPDRRPAVCRERSPGAVPACTVVIIFHNEAWSVLLRSVHSVLDTTPPGLLHAVLIVDDKSTMGHLGKPLDKYFRGHAKVTILRAPERGGLTRARLIGFAAVKTDIVVFLDSHIECMAGWYEPLAAPIADDYRTTTVPTIDNIDAITLQYQYRNTNDIGTLDLPALTFNWMSRPGNRGKTTVVESPVMPGGLFAISSHWFRQLGTYDPGLLHWGGENIELSFKVWMCNGSVVMVPCSHVGHIFRKINPIPWSRSSPLRTNSLRVASVWMDRYQNYYREFAGTVAEDSIGDLSERKALRASLHCHDFHWYIHNVFPELKHQIDTTSPYAGEVRCQAAPLCLDSSGPQTRKPIAYPCHGEGGNQIWLLTKNGALKQGRMYLTVKGDAELAILYSPGRPPEWRYQAGGAVEHVASGRCLQASSNRQVSLVTCQPSSWQRWTLRPRHPDLLQPV